MSGSRRILITIATISLIASMILLCGCKTNVENKEYSLEYNDKTYDGEYTGVMEDGKPNEQGKFVCGEEGDKKYLIYEGSWEKGEMIGKGNLCTNNYIVHFPKDESGPAFDREGAFDGEVVDGVASGKGIFVYNNDLDEEVKYDGEWKDGLWDGVATVRIGKKEKAFECHFEKGVFKPTVLDIIKINGSDDKNSPYELNDKACTFIEKNENAFSEHDKSAVNKNLAENFSMKAFRKNPLSCKPCFIKLKDIDVIQASESNVRNGLTVTDILAYDNSDMAYALHYFGKSKKLSEGHTISVAIMPHGYSTFENTEGGTTWSVSGTIAIVY